jgi:NAD+ kinase
LAWLPEFGWTLAKPQPNSFLARSIASLGDVDELAAAVVALARDSPRRTCWSARALRLQHGARDDVLRGDQLDLVALAAYAEDDCPSGWPRPRRPRSTRWRCGPRMCAGKVTEALAINEVSLLRQGPQAAKLRVVIDGRERLEELVCDGALVATPAGSTAYNYSAHGPILPIGSDVLALTAMAAFRPRRWRGALVPKAAVVRFDVLEPDKRPVMADADSRSSVRDVPQVEVGRNPAITHRLLFDPGHGLEERLIGEQFV